MILVHGFAGAITTNYTLKFFKKFKLSKSFYNLTWIIGVTSAVLPDFDLLYVYFNPQIEHRKLISHSIIPYFLFFISSYLLIFLFKNKVHKKTLFKAKLLTTVFFIGVLSHLILDFFVGGLNLFNPLNSNYYGFLLPFNTNDSLWEFNYFTSYYMLAEAIVLIIYLALLKNYKNIVAYTLPFLYFFVALIAIFFVF